MEKLSYFMCKKSDYSLKFKKKSSLCNHTNVSAY